MIQMYREGNTHVVKGIPCEVKNFTESDSKSPVILAEGWAFELPGQEPNKVEVEPAEHLPLVEADEPVVEDIPEESQTKNVSGMLDELTEDELKELAKEKGIPRFYNMKAETLKEKLLETIEE